MSTDSDTSTSTQDGNNSSDSTSGAGDEFKPITSQADLDARIGPRLERERSKYADYDDLKAKATRLDEIEAANKSELEKATEQNTVIAGERDTARAEALRLRIAVDHGIGLKDADLFLTGTDEETLRAQAKRLTEREADRKKNGNHVPGEGTGSTATGGSEREIVRGLFGGD